MSLIFMDGFDLYSSINDVKSAGWRGMDNLVVNTSGGKFGGGCVGGTVDDQGWQISVRGDDGGTIDDGETLIIGWYYKIDDGSLGNDDQLLGIYSGVNFQCGLRQNSSGALYARDDTDSTVGSASSETMSPDTWHYLEFKASSSTSSGTIIVRLDEVEVINVSGVDTQSGGWASVRFTGDNAAWLIDDVVIMNGDGGRLNDFLGEVRIATILPDEDTLQDDFIQSSSGSTASLLNTPSGSWPDDSEYIESNNISDETRVKMGEMPENLGTIHAISTINQPRKTNVTSKRIRGLIRSNGSTFLDDHDSPILDEYVLNRTIHVEDPGQGSPSVLWDETSLNNLEIGVRITS